MSFLRFVYNTVVNIAANLIFTEPHHERECIMYISLFDHPSAHTQPPIGPKYRALCVSLLLGLCIALLNSEDSSEGMEMPVFLCVAAHIYRILRNSKNQQKYQ